MTNHITQPVNMVDECDHVWRANATTQGAEFLGRWERIHNPESNYLEFEVIELEAGRKALFVRHITINAILQDNLEIAPSFRLTCTEYRAIVDLSYTE